ncbi:aquaporin [Azospirillum sp. TSO35-2]|uniref:aquaporin n=1 Tax=Azospirillum sp. TSO35-2 TaxID=716796 RepID=UPI000D61C636|nr:aquaporin [Azospirillum sp. TSO35-2]PWC31319.1 MIP family protein [Azospirillum sp. TSO35-2]
MNAVRPADPATCFVERDPQVALARRAAVEGIGTFLLMLMVAGAADATLRPAMAGGGLLPGALATAGGLVGLILAFGVVSGGHFNPLITVLQWLAGERRLDCTIAYVVAQSVGAVAGALLADALFGVRTQAVVTAATGNPALSEAVATAGLMVVVFGCSRSGRAQAGPFAVGAWLTAAILATPSGSYANPAVTLGALFTGGPVALPGGSALLYVAAQSAGALAAFLAIAVAYPKPAPSTGGTIPFTAKEEAP